MKYLVYLITNTANNKKYVGITSRTLEERWKEHIFNATNTDKKNILYCAIRKYGIDKFKIELIEDDIPFELGEEREQLYIQKFNTFYKNRCGYNMTFGGTGTVGYVFTDEDKQKMSDVGKNRKFSEDRNNKISAALKGIVFSDEHKQKLSDVAKLRTSDKNPFFGKHHTEDAKHRIREGRNDRLVVRLDVTTKETLQVYDGISDAANWAIENNLTSALKNTVCSNIINVCNKAYNRKSCYGYDWSYKERCND